MDDSLVASRIAEHSGGTLVGPDTAVTGIAPLGSAGSGQLTFVVDPRKYAEALSVALDAGATVLFPAASGVPDSMAKATAIVVDNPRAAFASAVAAFFVPPLEPGIAESARVHPSAVIAPSSSIGEFAVIGAGVVIGEFAEIRNHVVVASRVQIGDHALIKSHAVIGEEGFGIDKDAEGNNVRIPHLGSVVVGNHVEIGSFTTVCSGTIAPTVVGDYSKIDDHVHISHNVQIGRNVIITATAEVSGSVTLQDEVWLGPQSSIIQGLTIGEKSIVGMGAVVVKSIPPHEVQFGNPAKRLRSNP